MASIAEAWLLLGRKLKGIYFMLHAVLSHFSHVQPSATQYTVARQAPLSLGFSRQEHCSGLPFSSPTEALQLMNTVWFSLLYLTFFIYDSFLPCLQVH